MDNPYMQQISAMKRYGGNFASRLADAMLAADRENLERVARAFPELIQKYSDPIFSNDFV